MTSPVTKTLLIILDGYGIAENPEVSAIDRAEKPFIDSLFKKWPHSQLSASGQDVGLPGGQFGNSEVGHLNIGAGRIVWQELSRINQAIDNGSFFENEVLLDAVKKAKRNGRLHLMGLFSDGGVHSHIGHVHALLELAARHAVDNVFVHAFTDGRDTSPTGGVEYARAFNEKTAETGTGKLASVIGRYYAMDRDNHWERTRKAYDLLVRGEGETFESAEEALRHSYGQGVTDEFVTPKLIGHDPESRIRPGDVLLFFNLRGDRARQLTRAFIEEGFDRFPVEEIDPEYYSFTSYDKLFAGVKVAFPPQEIRNTLGEVISRLNLKQLRIAETEKYAHVTYFFNGGVEAPFEGEDRILIPSPRVPTYDLQPEMSAPEVAGALCDQLMTEKYHLCVLNLANPDMVGHTGSMEAAVSAIETIDRLMKQIVETAAGHGYRMLIIADHGNADCMIQEDGSPHTAHTSAPVPALIVNDPEATEMRNGILADVAPTLLRMMGIDQPGEMTGTPLY